jgi:hypothetical protein
MAVVGMIQKFKIDSPYVIGEFKYHAELKDQVLSAINEQKDFERLIESEDAVDITRCDWSTSRWDYDRKWLQILRPRLFEHLQDVTENTLKYAQFKIREIWFQQYAHKSHHGWHVHGSNWTNVYFLELPQDCPKTQFINPYNQTDIHEFDVKEGDILTFPSYVVHRAPINHSNQRKTIISWNMDTELVPGLYTE